MGIIQSYLYGFEYEWPIAGARENSIKPNSLQRNAARQYTSIRLKWVIFCLERRSFAPLQMIKSLYIICSNPDAA